MRDDQRRALRCSEPHADRVCQGDGPSEAQFCQQVSHSDQVHCQAHSAHFSALETTGILIACVCCCICCIGCCVGIYFCFTAAKTEETMVVSRKRPADDKMRLYSV